MIDQAAQEVAKLQQRIVQLLGEIQTNHREHCINLIVELMMQSSFVKEYLSYFCPHVTSETLITPYHSFDEQTKFYFAISIKNIDDLLNQFYIKL